MKSIFKAQAVKQKNYEKKVLGIKNNCFWPLGNRPFKKVQYGYQGKNGDFSVKCEIGSSYIQFFYKDITFFKTGFIEILL